MQLIFSVAAPLLLGLGGMLFFSPKKPFWLIFFCAYPIGLGMMAMGMFFLGLIKIPLTLANISILAALVFIFECAVIFKNKSYPEFLAIKRPDRIEAVLLAMLLFKTGSIFFEAMLKPVFTWDAWSRYVLSAKAIFIDRTFLTPFTIERMEDYPLLVPLNQAWIFISHGYANDVAVNIISAILFVSLLAVFYYGLRMIIARPPALFFTFLLSTLPLINFHAYTSYLDLPMTFFISAGTIFLFLFMKDGKNEDLLLSAILLGLGVWTKRAGIYLAGIDALALIIFTGRNRKSEAARFLLVIALISLPWLIYNWTVAPRHYYTAAGMAKDFQADYFARTPEAAGIFLDKMFHSANWHLSWALFAVSLVFYFRKLKSSRLAYLALIIGLNLFALVFTFQFTGSYQFLLDGTLFNRVMMYMMPLVLFFCGILIFKD